MNQEATRTRTDTAYFDEYTSRDAIVKYTRATAGYGISYLLDHDYKAVYDRALDLLPRDARQEGLRILEFGCGGGMQLIHLVAALTQEGVRVERAIGTDFSPVLIEAAEHEARAYLPAGDHPRIEFYVARNETLVRDLSASTGAHESGLAESFHLVIGVNTIRYCHRARREMDCARDIMTLLQPGGVCVVIDMNDRFPAFRSALKSRFRRTGERAYIPTLSAYASPFEKAGFHLVRTENFCWIPHSSNRLTCSVLRGLSPILQLAAPGRAMRSLVTARKPVTAAAGA